MEALNRKIWNRFELVEGGHIFLCLLLLVLVCLTQLFFLIVMPVQYIVATMCDGIRLNEVISRYPGIHASLPQQIHAR